MLRCRVIVRGRVQGVWFRDSVRAEALRAGVSGWVHNRTDGSVEAVFEGNEASVQRLVSYCRTGPPRARVDAVETSAEPPEGLRSFEVR